MSRATQAGMKLLSSACIRARAQNCGVCDPRPIFGLEVHCQDFLEPLFVLAQVVLVLGWKLSLFHEVLMESA